MLSPRIHSRYRRRLQDVTCGEVPVTIELAVRRWFCVSPGCPVRAFTEQVPEPAQPYAWRMSALRRLPEHIALALAGRASSVAARGATTSTTRLRRRSVCLVAHGEFLRAQFWPGRRPCSGC
ncbi:transposase family protein [Streptosporangium canum]|uniref:transposase family protein n=1 Tax=Streptosporangium canum TaxID=324952 RepID=UPI00343F233A